MEEKVLLLANLENKKGFGGAFIQNVSPACEQKHHTPKHSDSNAETSDKCDQNKTKNAPELPGGSVKPPKFFDILNAVCQQNKQNSFKKTCEKMDSTQPDIPDKTNKYTDCTHQRSSQINHSKGDAQYNVESTNGQSACQEKTDDVLNNDSMANGQSKEDTHTLKNLKSKNEDYAIFEEVFVSIEGEDVHNEIIPATIHSISDIPKNVQDWINDLPPKNLSQRPCIEISTKDEEPENVVNDSPSIRPAKLTRDESLQSSSSLDSLLDARRPDPVEIFLNLGFGGVPGVDMEICRIPKRFLVPSKCKGGDWNEFLKRELIQAQNFECSSLGFRGLSGPSYRRPSAIVANIMEKLRERSISQPYSNRSRFVKNEKSFDHKLSPEFQSVLSPDNRKFLQNQGKVSPEVPRRRIIFGQKSFAFGHDGEFVEVESPAKNVADSPKDVPTELTEKNGIESRTEDPKPGDNLGKYRRGSLQKQKKILGDEDFEISACPKKGSGFYGAAAAGKGTDDEEEGEEMEEEEEEMEDDEGIERKSLTSKKCAEDPGKKIPRRFLSSSNLKAGESETNLSEMMRREVEKEIRSLSQKIRGISDQELVTVLRQVKELSSVLESSAQISLT